MSTAFAHKLDGWQDHARAAHQKRLDDIAADEAAIERIWNDDTQLLAAVRHLANPEATVEECVDSYLEHLKWVAKRDNGER
jgi:hypothetical protein